MAGLLAGIVAPGTVGRIPVSGVAGAEVRGEGKLGRAAVVDGGVVAAVVAGVFFSAFPVGLQHGTAHLHDVGPALGKVRFLGEIDGLAAFESNGVGEAFAYRSTVVQRVSEFELGDGFIALVGYGHGNAFRGPEAAGGNRKLHIGNGQVRDAAERALPDGHVVDLHARTDGVGDAMEGKIVIAGFRQGDGDAEETETRFCVVISVGGEYFHLLGVCGCAVKYLEVFVIPFCPCGKVEAEMVFSGRQGHRA